MADPFVSSQVDSLSYSIKNKLYKINLIKLYIGSIPWVILFEKRLNLKWYLGIIRGITRFSIPACA